MDLAALIEVCGAEAEAACARLAHLSGWRFLTGPRATLVAGTQIALITLNPGGGPESAHQSGVSYEDGSCYVTERWLGQRAGQAPLQRQVQALFRELMSHLGEAGPVEAFLGDRVVTAHFIPFRSASFEDLPNPKASIDFARGLWTKVLDAWRPKLIFTIDHETFSNLAEICQHHGGRVLENACFSTGWGSITCEVVRLDGYRPGSTIVARLPHLSRFSLFSEPGYFRWSQGRAGAIFSMDC